MQRRLTTILAADIAGFSRLIAVDEEGTLATQHAIRADLVEPLLSQHQGRIANTAGDSFLIEFPSAVEAVRFATALQDGVKTHNADLAKDRQILYRIGINVGDVIAQGDDLLGDGVNIAARLEALAPPGGVIISRSVRDQVRDRLALTLEDLGEVAVKNIPRAIRAFQMLGEGEAAIAPPAKPRNRTPLLIAVCIAALVLISTAALLGLSPDDSASVEIAALPDKPSIAVLPFQDLSEADPQQWFGDGMAEDIITDLSKLSGLFVIARNSSFQFRGGEHDMKAIGRQLGVAFLLEGSVRRAGDALRINAQLIDATTGGHVWAERYDGDAGDVFALQDRVAGDIVQSLKLALTPEETEALTAQGTDSPKAHDAYLRGLSHHRKITREDYTKAKEWFDKAIALSPDYGEALAALADLYLDALQRGWGDAVGISDRDDAIKALRAALKHPTARAYKVEAEMLLDRPNPEAAGDAIERGLALAPSDPDIQVQAAEVQAALGNYGVALSLMQRAMRLYPQYPPLYLSFLGSLKFMAGDLAGAREALDQVLSLAPDNWTALPYRIAVLVELGEIDAARTDYATVQARWPKEWLTQLTAPTFAWGWGGRYGAPIVKRFESAFLAIGVPALPEGVELLLENKLSQKDMLDIHRNGVRFLGRANGFEWSINRQADLRARHYFNGQLAFTSSFEVLPDGSTIMTPDDPLGHTEFCQHFRNPDGSDDTLNVYVAVCNVGVFPNAAFPLPN